MSQLRTFLTIGKAIRQAEKAETEKQPEFRSLRADDLLEANVGLVVFSAAADADAFTSFHTIAQAIEITGGSTAMVGFHASGTRYAFPRLR